MHENTFPEREVLRHCLLTSIRCHFHIVGKRKRESKRWIRPFGGQFQFPSLFCLMLVATAVCSFQLVWGDFWRREMSIEGCFSDRWHWQEAQLSASVNISAHSSFSSTDELLRERFVWRGLRCVYVCKGSQLAHFAVKDNVIVLVKTCMC